jgi:hypothetical protein
MSLAIADTHSTSVVHHTSITGSCRSSRWIAVVLSSSTISGMMAELSQNLSGPPGARRAARFR